MIEDLFPDYKIILLHYGIKEEKINHCMEWAFGVDFGIQKVNRSDEAWNKLHSDIFEAKGTDKIIDTFGKIAEAYKERFQK